MPEFHYSVLTSDRQKKFGSVDAADEVEAVRKLQNLGFLVLTIDTNRASRADELDVNSFVFDQSKQVKVKRKKKVTRHELIMFFEQMSVLLDASVDILKSLEILTMQVESQPLYEAVIAMKSDVSGGSSLSRAMSRHPQIFPKHLENLVNIGEQSGSLPSVLGRISVSLAKTGEILAQTRKAMTYPCILVGVSLVVIWAFLVKVIPMFAGVFADFDVALPALTQWVVDASALVRRYLLIQVVAFAGIAFVVWQALKIPRYRIILDEYLLKVPALGELLRQTIVINFSNTFSMMLDNGVTLMDALDLVRGSLRNMYVELLISRVRDKVKGGSSVSEEMKKYAFFPPLMLQMVGVGEETGRLSLMLSKVGDFYERRIKSTIDQLSSLAEPLILIIMGGIIGVLVLAMFLPIFKLSQISNVA